MFDDIDTIDKIGIVIIFLLVLSLLSVLYTIVDFSTTVNSQSRPDVDWSFDRINSSYVEIKHNGGDTVSSSNIIVMVENYRRNINWSGSIKKGDTGLVIAEKGKPVGIYWKPQQKRYRIGRYKGQ